MADLQRCIAGAREPPQLQMLPQPGQQRRVLLYSETDLLGVIEAAGIPVTGSAFDAALNVPELKTVRLSPCHFVLDTAYQCDLVNHRYLH
jgi:hypothetical protein